MEEGDVGLRVVAVKRVVLEDGRRIWLRINLCFAHCVE
jgi:hypothetical protein